MHTQTHLTHEADTQAAELKRAPPAAEVVQATAKLIETRRTLLGIIAVFAHADLREPFWQRHTGQESWSYEWKVCAHWPAPWMRACVCVHVRVCRPVTRLAETVGLPFRVEVFLAFSFQNSRSGLREREREREREGERERVRERPATQLAKSMRLRCWQALVSAMRASTSSRARLLADTDKHTDRHAHTDRQTRASARTHTHTHIHTHTHTHIQL